MIPNHYAILIECVETGCRRGVARAFKHDDDPSHDQIETAVHDAVMLEICEKYHFVTPREETIEPYEL